MEPFLRQGIVPREYQLAVSNSALLRGNTLVVLPTGMGKTLVAFLVMQTKMGQGRIFFLAPTKPLVRQHHRTFLEMTHVPESDTALITGELSPAKRKELWNRKICFSTPQSLQNDLKALRAAADCSLCIIDEAHRSVGNYAYTFVAEKCREAGGTILGLTASPGGDRKRIQEIVDALGVENIEIRTAEDADVSPYIQKLEIEYVHVPLGSEFSHVRRLLQEMLADSTKYLANFGFIAPTRSKKGLVELRMRIMRASDRIKYSALSYYTSVFNLVHMLELIETQGLATFLSYVEKMRGRPETKARRRIFNDKRFVEVLKLCNTASEHPKLAELIRIVKERKGERILVFAQYRQQVMTIVEALKNSGFSAARFLGKKDGVTADEQRKTIERFGKGEFEVMAATSIGEEGLDIPKVDTVVFFEPIPSEIRSIQRRGRAGRLHAGKVVVLITSGTKDEASFHSSRKKEENMKRIVGRMQRQFSAGARAVHREAKPDGAPKRQEAPQPRKRKPLVQKKITDF